MRKKIITIISFMIILCSFTFLSAFNSEEQKVYDYAGLFTTEQAEQLQQFAVDYAYKDELDYVIVTTNDAEGKTAGQYADDFYEEMGFGYEKEFGSCVILLIDMDNREAYIATQGIAIQYLDDVTIESILDDVFEYLPDDYYNSALTFLQSTSNYAQEYISDPVNSDKIEHWKEEGYSDYNEYYNDHYVEGGKYYENIFTNLQNPLISIGISLIIAAIIVLILRFRSRSRMTVSGSTYMDKDNFNFNQKDDVYMGTTTVRREIPKSSGGGKGGSFHMGSGGHSHGGGGRGF